MPHLILSDASLAYGHVPLLDHADFQLDPGERVALIGRNGSGKSSALRALAGNAVFRENGADRGGEKAYARNIEAIRLAAAMARGEVA